MTLKVATVKRLVTGATLRATTVTDEADVVTEDTEVVFGTKVELVVTVDTAQKVVRSQLATQLQQLMLQTSLTTQLHESAVNSA